MKHSFFPLGVTLLATSTLASCSGSETEAAPAATSQPTVMATEQPVHDGLKPNPEMKESEHFTGRVILREALATGPGFVFVTVGRDDSPMPYLMEKYDVEGPNVKPGPDGSRVLDWELTSANNFMDAPLPDKNIELKVRFDYDGFVETKVDSTLETLPVEPGARDLEVTIFQAPSYNPAEDDESAAEH